MRSILVLAIALAGCSNHVTSLDGDLVLAKLSADEMKQFCTDFDDWAVKNRLPVNRRYSCALDAMDPDRHLQSKETNDHEAQEQCRALRTSCNVKNQPDADAVNCGELMKRYVSCPDLTIREQDDCLREDVEAVKRAIDEDFCEGYRKSFTSADYIKFLRRDRTVGPKCRLVRDKCETAL
ncbi:MAG TPA: hypothetical protein VGO00_02085 [Kofleriaceae bacterium]|jgi:hypothetical protein|nr:hypothetical protein [Kofleriaceae bacterium]